MSIEDTQSPAFSGFTTGEHAAGGQAGIPNSPSPAGADQDRAQGGAQSLKQQGGALKDKAMDRLKSEADARKQGVSSQLKSVSGALHAAQENLDQGEGQTPQWLTSGLQQVASTVELLADRIQDKSSSELIGEVQPFAKNQPVIFFSACAAIGFAAARVFKAGGTGTTAHDATGSNPSFGTQS